MLKVAKATNNTYYQKSGYSILFKCIMDILWWDDNGEMVIRPYGDSVNYNTVQLQSGVELCCRYNQNIIDSVIPFAVYKTEMGQVLYG